MEIRRAAPQGIQGSQRMGDGHSSGEKFCVGCTQHNSVGGTHRRGQGFRAAAGPMPQRVARLYQKAEGRAREQRDVVARGVLGRSAGCQQGEHAGHAQVHSVGQGPEEAATVDAERPITAPHDAYKRAHLRGRRLQRNGRRTGGSASLQCPLEDGSTTQPRPSQFRGGLPRGTALRVSPARHLASLEPDAQAEGPHGRVLGGACRPSIG
mmetsp:Transcript_24615/g.68567  ORF Transcript_24615/g.68567 Transcript_24615/m.68567 type:complete len:209 (-) Transcript_24615:171-797(-)